MATTVPASAHVTVGIPTLKVTRLTYRAPVEPAFTTREQLAAHHTQKVVVSFPAGFKVEKCYKTADFTCTKSVDQATWTRRPGSTNFGLVTIDGTPVVNPTNGTMSAAEFFDVGVRTPGIGGTYPIPAVQFYSDDDFAGPCTEPTCVSWSSPDPAAPRPAPQIRVNGPDRAPKVALGVFKPLSELGAGAPCPPTVLAEADALRPGDANNEEDRALHCGHYGFVYPADAPPPPPDPNELKVRGTAKLVRSGHDTTATVVVTGLEPGQVYSAHLHEGTCGNPTSAHYKNDPAGADGPPNELWPSSVKSDPAAGLIADGSGVAKGSAKVGWVARPTARAIWIHEPADPTDPHAHARIGCADLI
ncbi:MAG TPA: hypothetical protein VGR20_07005 [Acidimicrobiia bacterium]|nr:hypothetical protein [Acidimicrobiia bacterium]